MSGHDSLIIDDLGNESPRTTSLRFEYKVPRQGNGFTTIIPNLKGRHLILSSIDFRLPALTTGLKGEMEVSITHGGNTLKYGSSFFQIFDRISLEDYWYRLTDGDHVELMIRNKSNKDFDITVIYSYKQSEGIQINCSSYAARELKPGSEQVLLSDLAHTGQVTKIYLKSSAKIGELSFVPIFKLSQGEEPPHSVVMSVDESEVLLDFTSDEELLAIRPMLAYYQLDVKVDDDDAMVYVLAYGFK